MPALTVAAGLARALVDFAAAKGASRKLLLGRARLDPADLRHPDHRIPFERYVALMRTAKDLCRDPAFALHFGEAIDLSELSIVGHLEYGAGTTGDVLAQINRYGSLLIETGSRQRLVVKRRGREAWIVDTRPNPNAFPELTESTFARMVSAMRRSFGDRHQLRAVHVTHAAPRHRAEYDRVFQVPVVFESDCNALVHDASWLAEGVTPASPYVSDILAAHADRLLRDLERSKSMRGRVEQLLIARLEGGETDVTSIAAGLGLTRQTLFRRLKAEGVTFARVLDELRRAVAIECLRHGGLSVNETAYRVGFSDPAPFSRAFKRWTGRSPRAFQRRASLPAPRRPGRRRTR